MNGSRQKMFGPTLAALCLGLSALSSASNAAPVTLELKEQPLSTALRDFARQTGIQIAIQSELTSGKISPSLAGTFEPADALAALLKGTGLVAYPVNENTFGIRSASSRGRITPLVKKASFGVDPIRLAQVSGAGQGDPSEDPQNTEQTTSTKDPSSTSSEVDEIVVKAGVPEVLIKGSRDLPHRDTSKIAAYRKSEVMQPDLRVRLH